MDHQKTKKMLVDYSDSEEDDEEVYEEELPELEGEPDWSDFYTLEEKERFEGRVVYSFHLNKGLYLPPYISWDEMMQKIFRNALESILKGYKPNDMVQIGVQFIDAPVSSSLPMQRCDQVTGASLFKKIEMIDFVDFISWGSDMKLTVITVTVP